MSQLTPGERVLLAMSVFAGTLGIVVGYSMPGTGSSILKDFLVLASGAGVAFSLAVAGARASATERVRALCNRSVQRLGLVASHVRDASRSIRGNAEASGDDALLVVATSLENLAEEAEVSIGDLEEMAGGKISLDPLVAEAMARIEEAVTEALPSDQPEVRSKLLSAIAAPLKKLEAEFKDVALPVRPALPQLKIRCPECDLEITVKVRQDDPDIVVRNCFRCDERIYVKVDSGSIARHEKGTALSGTYKLKNKRAVIICPSCMNEITTTYEPTSEIVKTSCRRCTALIQATPEGDAGAAA